MTLQTITLFILPLIAGLSAFLIKVHNKRVIELILTFSGAYLFSLSLIHLLPELFLQAKASDYFNLGIFILAGFFLQLFLDFFSQGVEHGHIHIQDGSKFLISIFFGLSLHSILEGLPLGVEAEHALHCNHSHSHNSDSLYYGIIIHKIPAAFILGILLSKLKLKPIVTTGLIVLFALMTPIGIWIGHILEGAQFAWLHYIMAIVIGSFFHISTTILFESSTKVHKFGLYKIACMALGCLLALLTLH